MFLPAPAPYNAFRRLEIGFQNPTGMNGKTTANDDVLREEMATIAANMVAMTSLVEGRSSPINAMIAGKPAGGNRQSLAARVRSLLETTSRPTSDR